ncbi:5875_t:CDS:2, partial [Ambispora gerdemannii]
PKEAKAIVKRAPEPKEAKTIAKRAPEPKEAKAVVKRAPAKAKAIVKRAKTMNRSVSQEYEWFTVKRQYVDELIEQEQHFDSRLKRGRFAAHRITEISMNECTILKL